MNRIWDKGFSLARELPYPRLPLGSGQRAWPKPLFRREQAHPAFRKWAKDLKQGVLQQLHETQVEQDFNHVLLRGLGYTTQSDVASDQPWTLTTSLVVSSRGLGLTFPDLRPRFARGVSPRLSRSRLAGG